MPTFDDALALAAEKFKGIQDSAGQPYILHCMRVAIAQTDDAACQAAILHDLVEDTDVTLEELIERGYSRQVVDAIDALTHRDSDSYEHYVLRIAECELAKRVKLADLRDNYRLERVKYRLDLQAEDAKRLQKYILTYQFLTGQLTKDEYLLGMGRL